MGDIYQNHHINTNEAFGRFSELYEKWTGNPFPQNDPANLAKLAADEKTANSTGKLMHNGHHGPYNKALADALDEISTSNDLTRNAKGTAANAVHKYMRDAIKDGEASLPRKAGASLIKPGKLFKRTGPPLFVKISIFRFGVLVIALIACLVVFSPANSQAPSASQGECRYQLAMAVLKLQKRFYEVEERTRNYSIFDFFVDLIAGRDVKGETVSDLDLEFEKTLVGREGCTQQDVKAIFELSPYLDEVTSNSTTTWVLMQCCGFEVDFAWDAESGKIATFRPHADKNLDNNE